MLSLWASCVSARSGTPASRRRSSDWRCARAPRAPDRPPKTPGRCGRRRTTARSAAEQRLQVGVGEAAARPRGDSSTPQVTQQRRQRPQPARQLVAIACAADQHLGARRAGGADRSKWPRPAAGAPPRRAPPSTSSESPAERARRRCRRPPPPRRGPRLRSYVVIARSAPRRCPPASSRPKRSRWQRDRTVGSSTSGRAVTSTNDRRRRRLLERLQQRVLRFDQQRVGLVDDHDPAPAFERTVGGALDRVADLIDLDRAGLARLDQRARRRGRRGRCACRRRTSPHASRPSPSTATGVRQLRSCASGDRGQALADAVRARRRSGSAAACRARPRAPAARSRWR